jgi:hypothetical protein
MPVITRGRRRAGLLSTAGKAIGGLAAVAAAVLAVPATSAAAAPPSTAVIEAVPGLQVVEGSSALDSSSPKIAFATCPAGKVLLGTAGRTGGFFGDPSNQQVVLEGVIPVGNGVLGQASEDEDGYTGNWSLTVGAICAFPVAGLQVVTSNGVSDSVARKQKIAVCPSGKQLTGLGGAIISGATGQVRLEAFSAMAPFGTVPNAANITAAEDETGLTANWALDTYAICASPLPGLELVRATSAAGSPGRVLQSANCPSGKRVVGVGAFLTQSSGFGQVGLETLLTSPLASVGPPTAHLAFASEDQNGFAGTWTLTAQAICANI